MSRGDGGYDLGDAAFDPMELMEGPGIATSVERDKREAEAARRGDLPNLEATEPLEEIGAEAGAAGERRVRPSLTSRWSERTTRPFRNCWMPRRESLKWPVSREEPPEACRPTRPIRR